MAEPGSLSQLPDEPDIFLLPFSVPDPQGFGHLDAGVLSRRIPHFLHLLLNEGDASPTGLLEVQSPPEQGPTHWVTLHEPVDPQQAMDLLPEDEAVRALVTGVLTCNDTELEIQLDVHAKEGGSESVFGTLSVGQPMIGMRALVLNLARALALPPFWPDNDLLTERGDAFFMFLEGLDGAARLSSDLDSENDDDDDAELLLRPFCDALRVDPRFGLALRTAHMSIASALEVSRIGEAACYRTFDRCFATHPSDAEACVAVAEHLAVLGDDDRAQEWLEHATGLEPPPARGLESLGILLANRGETVAARDLWLRGLELDGHPDFLAHLARLAFTEGAASDAWDLVLRGLRRLYERAARPGEWDDDGRGSGLLLRYLVEHFEDELPPEDIAVAVHDLAGMLSSPTDLVELGRCLLALGTTDTARVELERGLALADDAHLRDTALRGLLAAAIPDFDRRFAAAVEAVAHGDNPEAARQELEGMRQHQPKFWPLLFFLGVAERRAGDSDRALDLMAEVLTLRPAQPDALGEMADMFALRGNPKRALECVDQALEREAEDVNLIAARARFLHALGRRDEALAVIDEALATQPDQVEFQRLRDEFGAD